MHVAFSSTRRRRWRCDERHRGRRLTAQGVHNPNLVFESSEEVKIAPTFVRGCICLANSRMHWVSKTICCAASTRTVRALHETADTDFEKPSAIQQRAILPILRGRDVIAQAQSGTGKTATFSISMLQTIDTTLRDTQALVLSPTRELATQRPGAAPRRRRGVLLSGLGSMARVALDAGESLTAHGVDVTVCH